MNNESKYDKYLRKNREIKPISEEYQTLLEYDWHTCSNEPYKPKKHNSILMNTNESLQDRWKRMLDPLASTCRACSMCELGMEPAKKNDEIRDPHVFSNMNPSKFMVVGQNPGWEEVKAGTPFIGPSGNNFDAELHKNGISRDDLYICNTVRCFTPNNAKPTDKHKQRCEPFLEMEIGLLKPTMVITLGQVAFSQFCPSAKYSDSLAKITKSDKYGVNVFAVFHPSPLNINDPERRKEFNRQMVLMCGLIKQLKEAHAKRVAYGYNQQ